MLRITLDTSAYSAFKRGHDDVEARIRGAEEILLPSIVAGELLAGFGFGRQTARNLREFEQFLASPRVRVVPTTLETANRYAAIWATLRRKGKPIATNDLWIAASTMEHGTVLVTRDRDFERVPQILVACYA